MSDAQKVMDKVIKDNEKIGYKIPIISGIIGVIIFVIILFIPRKKERIVLSLLDKIDIKNNKIKSLSDNQTQEKINLQKEILTLKKDLNDERKKGQIDTNSKRNKKPNESPDNKSPDNDPNK